MKVIVTGGRNFGSQPEEEKALFAVLSKLSPTLVVQGGASGADSLAAKWAYQNKRKITYPADWDSDGKSGGPKRNRRMVLHNHDALLVACPGGKGTENCIREALKAGLPVVQVKIFGPVY